MPLNAKGKKIKAAMEATRAMLLITFNTLDCQPRPATSMPPAMVTLERARKLATTAPPRRWRS